MRTKTAFWTLLTLALVALLAWLGFRFYQKHLQKNEAPNPAPEPPAA